MNGNYAEQSARDDVDLLAAHAAGDPVAFTALIQRHRDRLWAVAVRTMDGDREEAADVLQDALIKAMRNAGSFRGEAAVTTWLHRIVVNTGLDRLRQRSARAADPLGERDLPYRRDEIAAVDARVTVRAALAKLPQDQRDAVVLVDLMDLTVADAARQLGVAAGTVKSRCSRGRSALAKIVLETAVGENVLPGSGNHAAVTSVEAVDRAIPGTDTPRLSSPPTYQEMRPE